MKSIVLSVLLFSLNAHAQSPATLQKQVVALQAQVVTLTNRLNQLQTNPVLAIGPFVKLDPNPENGVIGPNIVISGANVHIVSGSGVTTDNADGGSTATGLGNLIIGYNEMGGEASWWLNPGDRGASHMLIMGRNNKYTNHSFGGIVTGWGNTVNGGDSLILGGEQNTVNEAFSITIGSYLGNLSGGACNVLVSGGGNHITGADWTVLVGGSSSIGGNPATFSRAFGAIDYIGVGVNGIQ